ncbi:uncharacterized protein EV420DRAFT_1482686 [Desarmillaria tabescens]|uniref:Uncharacterized protein n=1 Tax=Armillaria tabescens TaxID=1929756 RepID=A0AA39JX90_ARMTA|nr:uncharacterized protein EV420DRAFT_1482686 [Desarmillaria tabescens]KAK0450479.1 hypothetical protein EV420DRAFT_1482686 [Desarmillaria tabescens]
MSALNVVRQVAKITEAVVVFKLFEQRGKNKENAKELCESIANTIVVVDTFVRMHGEPGASHFKEICGEMEKYLQEMAQSMNDVKRKHRGLKGVFSVDDFGDAIQTYRRRVDDLKTDFIMHSVGDCRLDVTQIMHSVGDCRLEVSQMHSLLKEAMAEAVDTSGAVRLRINIQRTAGGSLGLCRIPFMSAQMSRLLTPSFFSSSSFDSTDLEGTLYIKERYRYLRQRDVTETLASFSTDKALGMERRHRWATRDNGAPGQKHKTEWGRVDGLLMATEGSGTERNITTMFHNVENGGGLQTLHALKICPDVDAGCTASIAVRIVSSIVNVMIQDDNGPRILLQADFSKHLSCRHDRSAFVKPVLYRNSGESSPQAERQRWLMHHKALVGDVRPLQETLWTIQAHIYTMHQLFSVYHPNFSNPETDTVLLSLDGIPSFVLRRITILFTSNSFAFRSPSPSAKYNIILRQLLRILSSPAILARKGFNDLEADAWGPRGMLDIVRAMITTPVFLREPFRVHAIAMRVGSEEEAELTSKAYLYEEYHRISPKSLFKFQRRRKDQYLKGMEWDLGRRWRGRCSWDIDGSFGGGLSQELENMSYESGCEYTEILKLWWELSLTMAVALLFYLAPTKYDQVQMIFLWDD